MLGSLIGSNFLSKRYAGSTFGPLYTFTDKDATDAIIFQNWSISGIPQITSVDLDDAITVGQTSAQMSGSDLDVTFGARIRYGSVRLDMQNYISATTPTFNVPSLTEFFSSGVPLGTVTFEILKRE